MSSSTVCAEISETSAGLSPRIRKSPFYAATLRYGVRGFSTYNRMYLPMGYDAPQSEFWHIVNDVTLWDVSAQRIVEITGPDAFRFTDLLTPRDLSRCRVGQCKYVLITDAEGGIVNDPVLSRIGEHHFWLSRADSDLLLWARGVATFAGMDVSIREPDVAPLQLQGPKSRPLVHDLFGEAADRLAYYECMQTQLDGIPVLLARTGWTAEVGYEIYLRDCSRGDALWEAIMRAGRPYGISPAAPSRIRRIEAGILDYGVDMSTQTNPFEVGLERLVNLEGPADFIGKAALARIRAAGVSRKLVGVEIHGPPLGAYNEDPWPARVGTQHIGELSSCIYSPRLEKNIGYVMAALGQSALGSELVIESPGGPYRATVVRKPFFDPDKKLPRARCADAV